MDAFTPRPISANEPGSFAHFTVHKRLPAILWDVRAQLGTAAEEDPRWAQLESAIIEGAAIDARLFRADTPYWRSRLASISGQSWADQPFFDLEFLFYHAVDSIAQDVRPGFDVFAQTRREALKEALPRVEVALAATAAVTLERALALAMAGNDVDLSQLMRGDATPRPESMLVNETELLLALLAGCDEITILADNAGTELCFDLVLIDVLLATRSRSVELQLKPRPMFVSDAVLADVEESIAAFEQCSDVTRLARLGQRLRNALYDGRLLVRAPHDWAEPRHMNLLSAELTNSLQSAELVLAKGDLSYRRFFEDRAWPADTSVATASVAVGMRAFALRVIKSESIVGLSAQQAAHLASAGWWRSNGRYSMLQRVDRGAG